jgi:hypothetical protein
LLLLLWLHCLLQYQSAAVHVPVHVSQLATKLLRLKKQWQTEHGSTPDTADLATAAGVSIERAQRALHAAHLQVWHMAISLQTAMSQTLLCLLWLVLLFTSASFRASAFVTDRSIMAYLCGAVAGSCFFVFVCCLFAGQAASLTDKRDEDHDSTMGVAGNVDLQQLDMSVDLDECEALEAGLTEGKPSNAVIQCMVVSSTNVA